MRPFIAMTAVFVLGACTPTAIVRVAPASSHATRRVRPLDIRFVRVDIEQMHIFDALDALSAAVRKAYVVDGEASPLSWSYSPSVGGTGVDRVSFHGSDVTLRVILNEFCRQTSMIYSDVGWAIEFDNHPPPGFRPEVRRPRKA